MLKAKMLLMTCIASLALFAVSSTSASAAEWFVGKASLGADKTAALATGTTTVKSFELVIVGSGLSVTCTGLQNNEVSIVGPASLEGKSLLFTGCLSNSAVCVVEPTITTNEVSGPAALGVAPASTLTIKPTSGETLMILNFTGETCAITVLPVKGQITMTSPIGQVEKAEHELFVSSSALKTGSNKDTLTGAVDVKLAGSSEWSFH